MAARIMIPRSSLFVLKCRYYHHCCGGFAGRPTNFSQVACQKPNSLAVNCLRGTRFYTNRNILRLQERDLLKDVVPEPDGRFQEMMSKQQCIYAGFDPTANSLHIGNLVVLMVLLHCQRGGHEVIAVVGGATAMVGDPSGKTKERPMMDLDTVERNAAGIGQTLHSVFENHEKYFWKDATNTSSLFPVKIVNNMDWYSKKSVIEFFSTVGRIFRMGVMLTRHSVEKRLSSPEGINYAEFSYQVCQAYDWLHLYDKYKCYFQVGGGDQLGNILGGYELISRVRKFQCHGILTPIVVSLTGDKLGKTDGTSVWLSPHKTSPFEFYQHFVRLADSEIETHLKMFTFLPLAEIKQIMDAHKLDPHLRRAQKKLAELLTLLIHGENGLNSAIRVTKVLYSGTPELLAQLSVEEIKQVFGQTDSVELMLQAGITILQMVLEAKCFSREVDARRIITEGGLHVNYRKTINPDYVLLPNEHILPNGYSVIRVGKKNYYLVKWIM